MLTRFILLLAIASLASLTQNAFEAQAASTTLQMHFVTDRDAGFPVQGVFVESTSTEVRRLDASEIAANRTEPAYASNGLAYPDPLKARPNPLGPFPKGKALGFTIGDWLEAAGSGSYVVDGETANVAASFTGLRPSSVYQLVCTHIDFVPSFSEVSLPCGAADGSDSYFYSDSTGRGSIHLTSAALPYSTPVSASILYLNYRSDGVTTGNVLGVPGINLHIQMAWQIMAPAGSQALAPISPPSTGDGGLADTRGVGLLSPVAAMAAGSISLGVAMWLRRKWPGRAG